MEKSEMIVRTFMNEGKKFVNSGEIKGVCGRYKLDYGKMKKLLLNKGFLITIFRGVFYLKDYHERKVKVIKYSPDELIAKGLELKGIKNWYFGLRSGLKFLNLTHEYFTRTWVLNDRMKRRPRKIKGVDYEFVKIKPGLFDFGIKTRETKNGILLRYSDLEKTVLDLAYLDKKKGLPDEVAKKFFLEYEDELNGKRLRNYSKRYPKSIRKLLLR